MMFTWAVADDLTDYEAFLRRTFGVDSVQAAPGRARWMYWDNPLGLHLILCRQDRELVAACGHLPYRVASTGGEVLAGFGVDMMVAKPWRRRGIGRRMLEMRTQHFAVSLSTGQSRDMAALYGQTNAKDIAAFELARWQRAMPGPRHPRAWLRDTTAWILSNRHRPPADSARQPVSHAEAAALIAQAGVDQLGQRRGDRWAEWYRWRYDGPVYRDYVSWLVHCQGCSPTILVTRPSNGCELIVDSMADPHSRAQVLAAAASTSTEPQVLLPVVGAAIRAALASVGFLVRPQRHRLISMSASGLAVDLASEAFFAGASDTDLMRLPTV